MRSLSREMIGQEVATDGRLEWLRHNIVLEHCSPGYYFDTVLKSYTLLFPNRAKNQSCSV
jgi:hypothetical protein